jgi:hypothetical protein
VIRINISFSKVKDGRRISATEQVTRNAQSNVNIEQRREGGDICPGRDQSIMLLIMGNFMRAETEFFASIGKCKYRK